MFQLMAVAIQIEGYAQSGHHDVVSISSTSLGRADEPNQKTSKVGACRMKADRFSTENAVMIGDRT